MAIGIGILGFAHGHVDMYCNVWREKHADEIRAIAGWDHDSARAAKARDNHRIELCDSAESLLARPGIDAVVIAAETSMHTELVERAANAGKMIVLQKPMSLTLDEADRIVHAVEEAKVPFTMAWQMRVDPQNIRMKQLANDGTLGRIFMLRRRHGLSTHTWPGFENTWHASVKYNKGMWADDASHAIDFVYWMLGEPQSVSAEIGTLHNPKVPDDNGIAIFRYADGTFAEVASSFVCLASENTTEIVGERGVVIQNYGDAPSCSAPRAADAPGLKWLIKGATKWEVSDIASPKGHGERIAALGPEILKFLQGKRPPIATAREGRTTLAMTLACYKSAESGRRVAIREMQS